MLLIALLAVFALCHFAPALGAGASAAALVAVGAIGLVVAAVTLERRQYRTFAAELRKLQQGVCS